MLLQTVVFVLEGKVLADGRRNVVKESRNLPRGTHEEKIIRLHQTKRELAENILDGTDISHKLTGKELLDMVRED